MLHNETSSKNSSMTIRLNPATMQKLESLSEQAERPKSYYVRKALDFYLEYLAEQDRVDVSAAEKAESEQGDNITLSEMRESLGLDD